MAPCWRNSFSFENTRRECEPVGHLSLRSTACWLDGKAPGLRKTSFQLCHTGKENRETSDIVERWFGKIFGTEALEVEESFGMKRLNNPEMYPADTTTFLSEVLPSDEGDVRYLRKLLANTQLEQAPLRLAYDSASNGLSVHAFHDAVNTYGAALLVCYMSHGAVVGGYNPRGWIGLGEDRDSIAAFLFAWPDGDMESSLPIKLPKIGGPSLAVVDKPSEGVKFGAEGLRVLTPGKEQMAYSRLGTFYEKMPSGEKSLFGNEKSAQIDRVLCYVAEGGPEEWELNGIVWSTRRSNDE